MSRQQRGRFDLLVRLTKGLSDCEADCSSLSVRYLSEVDYGTDVDKVSCGEGSIFK
jgi:hypothetical protein